MDNISAPAPPPAQAVAMDMPQSDGLATIISGAKPPGSRPPLPEPPRARWKRPVGIALIAISLIAGGIYAATHTNSSKAAVQQDATDRFGEQSAPLSSLAQSLSPSTGQRELTVNGQFSLNGVMLMQPSTQPTTPVAGQIYYDQQRNQVGYYDGKGFVYLNGGGSSPVTNNFNSTTVNNYATPVTNLYSTTTNVTNVSGGSTDSTAGTAGNLAMFTAPNTLGNSLIVQSGNNLSTGTGVESVVLGSTNGASTTVLQGGTGGVSINTGSAAGSSGSITLQSGASSTTAAGNVNIDTGSSIVTGTVVADKTFESSTEAMGDQFGFNDGITTTAVQAHGGAQSLQITTGTDGFFSLTENQPYTIPAVAGHSYRFSAWVRAATVSRTINFKTDFSATGFGGGGSTGTIQWGTGSDFNSGWTQISGTLVAPAGSISLAIWVASNAGAPGEVHYIDDITVTDLSSSVSVANLNLGATNAQSVTLGNANELGPTSVLGSGLTLNGGLGNTSLTGGAVTIFGQGNSSISSAGALTVTSSNSASWGILPSGFTGGSLTLHAGAGGGVDNGGNLVLQSGQAAPGGINGSITLDAPGLDTVSGTIIDQRGFETGTENMTVTTNATAAQSNTAVHSGGFSLSETSTAAGNWQVSQDQGSAGIPVTAGHQYYFSAWVRAGGVNPEQIHSFITWLGQGSTTLNPVMESGGAWMQISGTATAPAGATTAYWNFHGTDAGGIENYFDDLWVTDLSTATAVSNLNLGANYIQSVSLGNQNQVGATNIQGGAGINIDSSAGALALSGGNVSMVTPDDTGATGNIDIHSGASSTTASGNVSVDTGAGIVTGTVVRNDGFESDLDGIQPWILPSTTTQDCTQAHTGSCSMAVTGGSFWGVLQDGFHSIPVTAGHHYFYTAWVKAATGGAKISGRAIWNVGPFNSHALTLPAVTTSTAGWTQMSITGTAPAGATTAVFEFNSADGSASNGVQYIDDVVLTDLSSSSAVSELDLGANNAQILTLGNMSEIGATTINGGSGITMNAGLGDFDINGGALNINGSGASTLATSDGSLTVSAIETSDWGLGTANNEDGGDLTVHAGSPGAPDFNGGNLTLAAGYASANGTGAGGTIQLAYNTNKVGYTAIGASHDSNAENAMSANKITPASNGTVRAVSFYVGQAGTFPNNKIQMAIYDDSGGACGSLPSCPGNLIAQTTDQTVVPNSWNTVSMNFGVLGGTSYWVAWNNNATNGADNEGVFDSNGLGNHIAITGQTYGTWPGTFPTGGATTNTTSESLYLDEAISGGGSGYAMTTSYIGATTLNNDTSVISTGSQAFQVQDATGAALLVADTTDMTITVKDLIVSANLTVNGHIITGGSTPGIAAGTAACTTPTVSIAGTDTAGTITVTTGSGCAGGGKLATITFATAFGAAPHVNLTPGGSNAQTLGAYADDSTISTTAFDLDTAGNPADTTTYKWNYWVAQ